MNKTEIINIKILICDHNWRALIMVTCIIKCVKFSFLIHIKSQFLYFNFNILFNIQENSNKKMKQSKKYFNE